MRKKKKTPLLAVDGLHVSYSAHSRRAEVAAVRGVSFTVAHEKVGIVGESGSGKSSLARAVLGLLPPSAKVWAKRLSFDRRDLLRRNERSMRTLRGKRLGFIPQDARIALNPVMTVGAQIAETCSGMSRRAARARVLEMLEAVRMDDPQRVWGAYPHQLSGGMCQRAMIAMTLLPGPDLLIADEPSSALDVHVRGKILNLMEEMARERGMGLLFISHDMDLVGAFCDRILVMYGGRILESLAAKDLARARHPYTRGLMTCAPRLREGQKGALPVLERDPAWFGEGEASP
jgi:peptide/nickel transport system ATP-binding protein